LKDENLNFVYALKREQIKYDLNVMKDFDHDFHNPHKDYKKIHITGSNGKGSVSNMIFNVLRIKAKTGLYTSPHLVRFNERIFCQNNFISDSEIEQYLNMYKEYIATGLKLKRNPTFFEVTTEMAFQYFKDMSVDYASIEVGLGGRLDATNIITPEISVITRINYEHTDRLGTTLAEIATEKGGIIKEGIPVVVGEDKPEPLKVLTRIADKKNSKLIKSYEYAKITGSKYSKTGSNLWITTPTDEYEITINLPGLFQTDNVKTVITALENLNGNVTKDQIQKGIANSRWPGRMDIVKTNPLVMLDSSHNPSAAQVLSKSIMEIFNEKPLLVVGMLSDKDHYSYLQNISQCSDSIILTTPNEPERKMDPKKLKVIAQRTFKNVEVIEDPWEAYNHALKLSNFIVVTGSMYLIGLISDRLGENMYPFKKQIPI
jgi:dihydrofolate synthase/folylpolyglutamate synthase